MIHTAMAHRATGSQYMLLANHLIEQIRSGRFPPGSLLPSELELGEQFDVSRITVRSALKELETKGLVTRHPGIGTRVGQPRGEAVFAHLGASVDEVLRFTKGVSVKVLRREEITVDRQLADKLELQVGQRFVFIETVRQKRGAPPLVYSRHYVPALLAPSKAQLEGLQISIAQAIADRNGDEVQTIRQQFAAVPLPKAESEYLQSKAGSPALQSIRWYYGREDRLLIASVSLFPGSQYTFTSTLQRSV